MKLADFIALYMPQIHLESYKREFIERLELLDFADLERRVLATPYRLGGLTDLVLGVDFATEGYPDLTSVCIARKIYWENGEVKTVIIDDIYQEPPMHKFLDRLYLDECPPVAQEAPEPTAKNGTKASKKTERAKAKLPFYHKNRRF